MKLFAKVASLMDWNPGKLPWRNQTTLKKRMPAD
jgi:hypothetical protein